MRHNWALDGSNSGRHGQGDRSRRAVETSSVAGKAVSCSILIFAVQASSATNARPIDFICGDCSAKMLAAFEGWIILALDRDDHQAILWTSGIAISSALKHIRWADIAYYDL